MIIQYYKKIILLGFKQIILKQKLKENGYPWIKVPKQIIKKYRDTTNKNKHLSDSEIEFKLNREYYSARPYSINDKRDIVLYGYLRIKKDNTKNIIVDIHNSKQNICGNINYIIKDKINSIYALVYKSEV